MSQRSHPSRRQTLLAAAAVATVGASPWARGQSAAAPAAMPEGGYRFSPVPQQSIPLVAGYWNPILAWVSARSGVKLQLKISRTSAETTAYVLREEVEGV